MANTKKTKQTAPRGTMRKVLKYVSRHGFFMVVSIILAVIVVALTLYAPILIGEAIDLLADGKGALISRWWLKSCLLPQW